MYESLEHQAAIVVGASSGIGRAIAAALARAGARVLAAARREDRLAELRRELAAGDHPIATTRADVAKPDDVARMIDTAVESFGTVDLLVYAAGTNIPQRSLEVLTPENWDSMLRTNLTGAFLCTRQVLPVMRARGGGLIVYISSAAVQMPDVSGVAYQASKHGLSGLAHGTRVEEKRHGIRTSVVYPGLCDTEILARRPVPTPREVLDKALDPSDVAEAVLFIARLHPRAVVPELQLLPSRL